MATQAFPEEFNLYCREICKKLVQMQKLAKTYDRVVGITKCTESQQKIITKAWFTLTVAERDTLMTEIKVGDRDPVRLISQDTDKNDLARLVHVFADPALADIWTDVFQPLSRPALDDKEHRGDAIEYIADAFNDYETYFYENPSCRFVDGRCVGPAVNSTFHSLCHDIVPSLGLAKRPRRDGAWIKKTLLDFKSKFYKKWKDYHKSGEQDGENPYDEFLKFYEGNDLLMYAFHFAEGGGGNISDFIAMMGKELPEELARDTGVLGEAQPDTGIKAHGRKSNAKGKAVDDKEKSPSKKLKVHHIIDGESKGNSALIDLTKTTGIYTSILSSNLPSTAQGDKIKEMCLDNMEDVLKKARSFTDQLNFGTSQVGSSRVPESGSRSIDNSSSASAASAAGSGRRNGTDAADATNLQGSY